MIGDRVSCSCGVVENDHCIHTLYVMLKKYKVPENNAIIWQCNFSQIQLLTWTQNWRDLSNSSIWRRKKNSMSANSSLRRKCKVMRGIKQQMISLLWMRMKLVPYATRIWSDSAIPLVQHVINVCIVNV